MRAAGSHLQVDQPLYERESGSVVMDGRRERDLGKGVAQPE